MSYIYIYIYIYIYNEISKCCLGKLYASEGYTNTEERITVHVKCIGRNCVHFIVLINSCHCKCVPIRDKSITMKISNKVHYID